jgi:hypothetical protein
MALVYEMIFPRVISYQQSTLILPTNQGCHLVFFETERGYQKRNNLVFLDLKKFHILRPVLTNLKQNLRLFYYNAKSS